MARLDGKKSSSLPFIIGAILLVLAAAGAYSLSRRNASSTTEPVPVQMTNGSAASSSAVSSSAVSSSAVSSSAASSPAPDAAVAKESTDKESGGSNPASTIAASAPGTDKSSSEKDVVAKRSKTLANEKTGVSVTYSKEVHRDGTVSRDKATSATPTRP
jgi:hypothetical protein